jgi:tripartite-type tricarboxylate transporter receptor subunit TctC
VEGIGMTFPRRRFLHLTAAAAALPSVSRMALAFDYPTRPVRFVVGFPAGSATDIVARLVAQSLSERVGQQFIVDDRPGAGSNLAAEVVVRADPDGYTLLQVASPNAINATLYNNLGFNFIRDIAPVAGIMRYPYVMVVNRSLPAKTVPEFIAYAKANPGKINMASAGNGTAPHVFGALFMIMTGVNMLHVPYRGSYFSDLIAGQVQAVFSPLPSTIGYIKAGTLRALAVTTAVRSDTLPDVPAIGEFVAGYEASSWQGVGAPRSTPAVIIETLNRAINAVITDPRMKGRLAELGGTVLSGSPADFGKFIADETAKWAKVIKTAHIRLE